MNAVINAARNGVSVVGGKLYLYGWDCHKKVDTVDIVPCKLCSRVLVNAGIVEVIYNGADGFKSLFVDDLLRLGEAI
jgi:deoxycytidylate deaminase